MIGLLLAGLALDPGPALAPSPVDLLAAAADLDRRLDGAEAAARALGRVHTALAEAERKAGGPPACDDPAVVALLPAPRRSAWGCAVGPSRRGLSPID